MPSAAGEGQATCLGKRATLVGTPGDDVLQGTGNDDVIAGLAGSDRIHGRAGSDLLCGGLGDDLIHGGLGSDQLQGGPGSDGLFGGRGDDSLDGGTDSDSLLAGPGMDTCRNGERPGGCERPPVTLAFAAAITPEERGLARRAAEHSVRYLGSQAGVSITGFTVFVFAETSDFAKWMDIPLAEAARRLGHACGAYAGNGLIVEYRRRGCGWEDHRDAFRYKLVAHEYFHFAQDRLSGAHARRGECCPGWLREGAAELFGFLVLDDAHLYDFAASRADSVREARRRTDPLEHCSSQDNVCLFDLGFLAVDFLTGSELAPLLAFWEALGHGVPWKHAFRSVFGRSVQAFYDEFGEYRRGLRYGQGIH